MIFNWKTTYFPVLGVSISQTVRTAVARLPFRQLGFLVSIGMVDVINYEITSKSVKVVPYCRVDF